MKLKPQRRRRTRLPRLRDEPYVWPEGYYRVTSGPILPDDLVLSVMTNEFLPFGSTKWTGTPATDAEDAFMVARKPRLEPAPGQTVRTYSIRKEEPPADLPPAVAEEPEGFWRPDDDQPVLF